MLEKHPEKISELVNLLWTNDDAWTNFDEDLRCITEDMSKGIFD